MALLDAPASGRLAVGEAITNIIAADIGRLTDIRLSANWMAACGEPGEDADLYATVRAVGVELCAKLGITIPVGKDSLSMRTAWTDEQGAHSVIAPVSLIVSAFAPVSDARRTLTPELDSSQPSRLLLIDLGSGKNRLGGSCWAQVFGSTGGEPADLDEPELLRDVLCGRARTERPALIACLSRPLRWRSAGDTLGDGLRRPLRSRHRSRRRPRTRSPRVLPRNSAPSCRFPPRGFSKRTKSSIATGSRHTARYWANPCRGTSLTVAANGAVAFSGSRDELHRRWSEVSFRMQALRDNPECAREEYSRLLDEHDPGLHASLSFDPADDVAAPYIARGARPAVAVLREQGVNSQTEMAAVFTRAGFDAYDVHMTDILTRRVRLSRFHGLVACGGFSYGDVLGAGEGWAKSILFNPWRARRIRGLLRARRHVHARRVQRLPNALGAARS